MHLRDRLGTLLIYCTGPALIGCGDDGVAETGEASEGQTGPGPSSGEPTPTEPTGTGADESTDGATGDASTTDDDGTTGETGAPAACDAIELPDALVEAGAWDGDLKIAGFAGYDGFNPGVHDLAHDADGGLLAAGYFRYIGDEVVPPLARRGDAGWTGEPSLDAPLELPTLSAVAADELGSVAIATYSALGELAQRDGQILLREDGEFKPIAAFKGAVRRMVWFEGALWVAGVFEIEGEAIAGLAVYDDMGWHEPPGGPLVGAGAYALTTIDDELLVGGAYTKVGGVAAQSVASWDGQKWTGHDLPESVVYALARDGEGALYAGGLFSVEGSFETGGVARWTGDAWASVAGGLANPSFRGVVSDLALYQGALYVAGCFSSAGGVPADPAAVPVRDLARWTGDAWEAITGPDGAIGTAWFSPLKCGDEGPDAPWEMQYRRLLADGDRLYLGGSFPGVDHTPSQSIIALAGGEWVAQGEARRGFSGATRALAAGGPECSVHVMGGVTHTQALEIDGRVLRDDGDAWTPVGPPIPKDTYCWQFAVDADGVPALGCDGPAVGDDPPPGVVLRLADDAWTPVGEPFAEGGVAVVGYDPTGALWAAGGSAEGFVRRLEGEAFVGEGGFNGRVQSLAFRPGAAGEPVQAVVGGYFTALDGTPSGGVARWDGAAWESLGAGPVGSVLAVAYAADGAIYASTADDGTPGRHVLGRWDGAAWSEVATPEPGPVPAGYAFNALVARGNYVVAAGFAWPNSEMRNIFVYDGAEFTSLRGGATAISVDAAVLARDGLWFGGTIAEAGPPDARISSVGIAHLE